MSDISLVMDAVQNGCADAQCDLGSKYLRGECIRKDCLKGVELLRKAAMQGHMRAQTVLGEVYNDGREQVPKDRLEALRWFRLAAEQGGCHALATLGGFCHPYSGGLGYSVELETISANEGGKNSQFYLGVRYEFGLDVLQDYVEAHKWYNLSAAHHNVFAGPSRDSLARKMTDQQISEAQALARRWQPRNQN